MPLQAAFSDPDPFQLQRSKIEDEFEDDLLAATPRCFSTS